jgi:hypothetical protein
VVTLPLALLIVAVAAVMAMTLRPGNVPHFTPNASQSRIVTQLAGSRPHGAFGLRVDDLLQNGDVLQNLSTVT